MNPTELPPRDPRLTSLLRSWRVETSLPPGFTAGVWRRLAAQERHPTVPLGKTVARWIVRLQGPRFALASVLLLLLAGAGAGAWQGRSGSSAIVNDLRERYIQSVDPFAADHP